MNYAPLLRRILGGEHLTQDESRAMIGAIVDGTFSQIQSAALLAALAAKGETIREIAGAAMAMRERSLHVDHGLPLVADIVGTGGDGADTINISTLAALAVAAAGVPVAKHGNRAASSSFGSADVLEAQGLAIDIAPDRAARMLRAAGFTFMFAQRYHPAMRTVGPVRRELGVRTIFNILGPLTNPARANRQLVGVARPEHVSVVGEVLQMLGTGGAVVHAASGIDEVSGEGPTTVYEFGAGGEKRWSLEPQEFGVAATLADLRGGSPSQCREAFTRILEGERSPRADVVALNAALALHVCGKVPNMKEGVDFARSLLHEGRVADVFERARQIA